MTRGRGRPRLPGDDLVGGEALSLEERSMRLAKALMSIVAEFSAYDELPVHSVRELCEAAFGHVGLDYREFVEMDPQNRAP